MQNGPLAVGTSRREELMIVLVTVRLSISLKEACGAQLHFTYHTHKVFRMPRLTQRCDHLYNRERRINRSKTRIWIFGLWKLCGNFFSSHVSIDLLYLSHNGFVAGGAVALGHGAYANLLQVRAQPAQQVIDCVCFLSRSRGRIWTCRAAAGAAALLVLQLPTFCFLFDRSFLCQWWWSHWRPLILMMTQGGTNIYYM